MNPASENTSILLLATIAAGTALASPLGGSAPLSALLAGLLLKQFHQRPWSWPRQFGTAASLLVMLGFVVVSLVAAQQPWDATLATTVLALVGARGVAKIAGVVLGNPGSGTSWRQAHFSTLENIADALTELPSRTRYAFEMYRLHGVPQKDIAKELGVSPTLVNFMIRDALVHCRKVSGSRVDTFARR